MKPAFLLVKRLSQSYDSGFIVVMDRLEIARGSIVCLVGPTGAGKSTLLKLLSGVDPPTSGSIELEGESIGATARVATSRRIAMVYQKPLLLSTSVRHNVEYGLRVRGDVNARTKAAAMIAALKLDDLKDRASGTLSGGQAQLVGIARALVIEPDVLLVDEPTSNLDPARVALVEQVLSDLQQRRGTTIVWATHNLFQARRVATDVALLLEGGMIEYAPVHRFFTAPSDRRTSAFINGEMIY